MAINTAHPNTKAPVNVASIDSTNNFSKVVFIILLILYFVYVLAGSCLFVGDTIPP